MDNATWTATVYQGLAQRLAEVVAEHCPSSAGCGCLELRTSATDPLLDTWLANRAQS